MSGALTSDNEKKNGRLQYTPSGCLSKRREPQELTPRRGEMWRWRTAASENGRLDDIVSRPVFSVLGTTACIYNPQHRK